MVVVVAAEDVDVHGDAGALGEALQAVRQHLAAQLADALAPQAELDDAEGPVRQVDDGARQRLVQRRVRAAEARQPARAVQRRLERLAQRDERVFCRVVVVDCGGRGLSALRVALVFLFFFFSLFFSGVRTVQVAPSPHPQAPPCVLRQRVQHVVQEPDPRVDVYLLALGALRRMALGLSVRVSVLVLRVLQRASVQVQAQLDLRLVGVAVERRAAYPVRHIGGEDGAGVLALQGECGRLQLSRRGFVTLRGG